MRKIIISLAALAAVVSLAACGSSMSPATKTVTATDASSPPVPAASSSTSTTPSAADLTGPIGTPYTDTDYQGNKMEVTLTHVTDPAQGSDQFTTPDNGNRFVGADFTISGMSGTFSDDANSDATVVGSDGQTYQADFNNIAGCTNFNAGEFNVGPGQTSKGCVTFQVPLGVKVAQIQWNSSLEGTPATWTVH